MSSFKRKTEAAPQKPPSGAKLSGVSPNIIITSSGIPSLDDVLGGGIQLGTSLLILNPDPHSAHIDLLQKYFIAQGLASEQVVHVFDSDARLLAETCMWMPGATATPIPDDADESADVNDGKVRIAWRYEHMQKFKTTVSMHGSDQEDYCRPFDLSCPIPSGTIATFLAARLLRLEDSCIQCSEDIYESVLQRIEKIVDELSGSDLTSKRRVVRLSIPAFSSPIWGDSDPGKILRFLLRLRSLLRHNELICAFITIPAHMSSEAWVGEGWIEKLAWASDACITLTSFAADPANSALFPSHHGVLNIHRLPGVQTLVPASDRFSTLRGLSAPTSSIPSGGIGENNLAFKCTRKRFIIETFHLDIDGGVGDRRTTPAASSIAIQEGVMEKLASQQHSHYESEQHSKLMIEMEDQTTAVSTSAPGRTDESKSTNQEKGDVRKKAKKRVGFQMDRPDIFDF